MVSAERSAKPSLSSTPSGVRSASSPARNSTLMRPSAVSGLTTVPIAGLPSANGHAGEAEATGDTDLGQLVEVVDERLAEADRTAVGGVDDIVAGERRADGVADLLLDRRGEHRRPVTSATPMSTGAAVRAVRRGLRCTLPRAITPVTPRAFATGAPSTCAIGLASTGPSSSTAANRNATPTPSRIASPPAITITIDATPITERPPPPRRRRAPSPPARARRRSSRPPAAPARRRWPGRARRAARRPCRPPASPPWCAA